MNDHGRSPNKSLNYLHGFTTTEQDRLFKQAEFGEYSVYKNIDLSEVDHLLEVGCGVAGQSSILLRRFPKLQLTGIDLNDKQLETAKKNLSERPYAKDRYTIQQMDAQSMDFSSRSFDGAFLCWILEHVPNPKRVLSEVRRVLKPGSVVYITEVMNSTFFLDPYSPNVWAYWMAFNDYQYNNAGDPFIGGKLGNLMTEVGFQEVQTEVITWHYDHRHPDQRKKMIEYWADLLMSASDPLIKAGYITEEIVNKAKVELAEVRTDPSAVFMYSFVQAKAKVL